MILVTLGTQDKSFKRLLLAIDKQIILGNIKEEVIVQAGYTKYESKNMKVFDYIPMDEFNELVNKCDILITHGGVGSIVEGLKNNKKIIACARLKEYGEHTNDHQIEIIEEFSNLGYLIELKDFDKLDEILKEIINFKPKKFISNTSNMIKLLNNYIEESSHKLSLLRILLIIFLILLIISLIVLGIIFLF